MGKTDGLQLWFYLQWYRDVMQLKS